MTLRARKGSLLGSKPPRSPQRKKLPSLSQPPSTPDDSGLALTPASLKHLRRQRDKALEENQRLQQDFDKLDDEHTQLQKSHQALKDEHQLCGATAARLEKLQKEHSALQAAHDSELAAAAARLQKAPSAHSALREAEEATAQLRRELEQVQADAASEREQLQSMAGLAMQAQKDAARHVKSAMAKDQVEREERERTQRDYIASVQAEMRQALNEMNRKFEKLKSEALMGILNKKLCVHVLAPKTWLLSGKEAVGYSPSQLSNPAIREIVDREVLPHFQSVFASFGDSDRDFESDAAPRGSEAPNCKAYAQLFAESVTKFVKHALERTASEAAPTPEEIVAMSTKDTSAQQRFVGRQALAGSCGTAGGLDALKAKYMGLAETKSRRKR